MGWFGKLLRIDLTTKKAKFENIPEALLHNYVGGKGLATAYFVREISHSVDPLGEANSVYIAPGVLSGTPAPASSRFHAVTKSPLTGIYLDASSGGHFGPELRAFGVDLLIIEGRAQTLTGLYLNAGRVDFLNAEDYRGMGVYDTETRIRSDVSESRIRVLSIGLAGENMVRYSCLGNDYSRNIGRGGFGAVFGSKNLKFLAVKGIEDITAWRPKEFVKATLKTTGWIKNNPWVPGTRQHGTAGNVAAMNDLGILPAWNFSGKVFEGASRINHVVFGKRLIRRLSCANCTISCSKGFRDTRYTGGEVEGPEFETLALLGSNIGLDDPDGIAALNYLCNQFGMDTITTGAVAGLVFDALRRNIAAYENFGFTKEMSLTDQGIHLITMIAMREGPGNTFAEGSRPTAEYLGITGEAPEVKGLDIAGYDPRSSAGMSLAYQTSDRGACHLRSFPIGRENSGVLEPGDSTVGKAAFVSTQQNAKAAQECLGICQFPYGIGINNVCIPEMVTAFTGHEITVSDLSMVGERIWNLARLFNNACGIGRKDDYLPDKISKSTMLYGPTKGRGVSRSMQDTMLDEYYDLRRWSRDGIPKEEHLQKLGIMHEATLIRKDAASR